MKSLSNNYIKIIRSLSQKRYRDEYGLFIVEGEKLVKEAINSDFTVKEVLNIDDIGEETMKKISCLNSPSPLLAIVEQKQKEIEQIDFSKQDALFFGLCGIRDPGNFGTIIRLADWFGIDAIFCSSDSVELYNPKVVQSTMGAIFRKNIIYTDIKKLIQEFKSAKIPVYGTFLDGDNIYDKHLTENGLILLGNESAGIPQDIDILADERLLIPKYKESLCESLNVATATAILCSEFRRGR